MPSPFPGMDPYLEHPALWPGVHQGLITFMWSALNAMLPARGMWPVWVNASMWYSQSGTFTRMSWRCSIPRDRHKAPLAQRGWPPLPILPGL